MTRATKHRELRWLIGLTRPYRGWMLAGVLLATLVILANVALLALSGWFIAAMALAGLGGGAINYFTPAAAIRGLAIARTAGRYLERLVTHEATFRLLAGLRQWFFEHLEPLVPARLQDRSGGDLLSRIRADIDSLEGAYLRLFGPVVTAVLTTFLMGLFLLFWSPGIAAVDLAGLLLAGIVVPMIVLRTGLDAGRALVEARATLRQRTAETLRGLAELNLFGNPQHRLDRLRRDNAELIEPQRRQNRLDAGGNALNGLIAQFTWLGMLVLAIDLVRNAHITGPELVMLALFGMASFEAVAMLPPAWRAWGETRQAARRILDLVDAEPAVPDPDVQEPPPTRFDLDFDRITLRYPGRAEPALDAVSLVVPQGGIVALRGASGSGKTSLLNALLRFWPLTDGDIRIGGRSIRTLSGDGVRGLCAVVSQHTHLFNTTIATNLRLARPEATEAELRAVLAAVGLDDAIAAWPQGLDTEVGEAATRLSGGQARRIAIARALLKDAPVVLLDEPTEGLDAASERVVVEALRRLIAGRTALMISHRPQLLSLANQIVHLDQGRIVHP
ncbi:thiol reductant ABC exporter subunit CydC [Halothiobacillus diazotrophicus]|uniref:Thiol reductant ABC exporter subunit CydC n=1 Tax=Halothiobacillus diazotrophicus TaxID=1860122 RepID=A0A191ZJJ8_9GAMM|nr:thiol reductant ABC exporter subunit CydC [Halothiobacillus diazotrophicus]ANJ68022.1 thiol reductant ABC exporter subunit CydC [Halothiobacillus diazotrophicus]